MLAMRDHDVEDYAALRDMDSTDVSVLDEADRACLDEVGKYLVATDAWQRFSIWLLHKHFEPSVGEVFVETVQTAPRGTQTGLVDRSSAQDLTATSMRFDADIDAGVGLIGMEFADRADFGSTPPLSADDEAVLAGIAERLRAQDKTDRFGVRLVRNPLGLEEREVLLETCDPQRRTLRCSVADRDGVRAAHNVETSWQWKPNLDGDGPAVMQYCATVCVTDPDGHHWSTHA